VGRDAAELGRAFVEAIVAKDAEGIASTLDPEIDFRGMTPNYEWRATTPEEVVEIVLGSWFEPQDLVREILDVETLPIADRHRLRYRFRVECPDGEYFVEQQAYFDAPDGRITRMSAVCSGFRPWEAFAAD
jgi:hypothetical protein